LSRDQLVLLLYEIGFTLILVGYLMVWLPQPVAGLSFIGLEMGEWVKFLPQVRSGEIPASRNFFYLPPVVLGLMLALWTTGWPNSRWRTWVMRLVAIIVAMLAFPAVEAMLEEGLDQWLGRVLMILLVAVVAALIPLLDRLPGDSGLRVARIMILALAAAGIILPTWAYLEIRPAVAQLLEGEVGIGPGVWLNGAGFLLVAIAAVGQSTEVRRTQQPATG
jgi:hypothetical protein